MKGIRMKTLLIGKKEDMNLVCQALKNEKLIDKTVYWNDEGGAEEIEPDMLSVYDCVIVAWQDEEQAEYLYGLLATLMGDDSRIINFYAVYRAMIPDMVVDRVMKNPLISHYDGMILGISHALCGLIPRCFDDVFCNLAVSSQDIYYNYKTLEHCFLHYREKIAGMKYLVFDMFDYTYFNYDLSLSKLVVQYHFDGGFTLDSHNFSKNKNIPYQFDAIQTILQEQKFRGITREKMMIWETLFDNVHEKTQYQEYRNPVKLYERARIVKDEDLQEYQVYTSIVRNLYQETLQENISSFHALLNLAYQINPDMKVFLILMPRYSKAEEMAKEAYAGWKDVFYDIIEESNKKYPFVFLDLKEHEISKEKSCYYDVSHLNYYGAVKFTKILNEYIKREQV